MEKSTTKYDVIQTGIYNGNYQAKLGYFDKEGNFKIKSYPAKNKAGEEKFVPVCVTIGEKEMAVSFLLDWLEEITGDRYEVLNIKPQQAPLDDVPF